jgi:hypothetical protein
MHRLDVGPLPADALAAAAQFHAAVLPRFESELAGARAVTLVFAPADHTHRAWRLGAVQGLARRHAPRRVNALASDDERAVLAALTYLAAAEGVTGQYLSLDGNGAEGLLHREQ